VRGTGKAVEENKTEELRNGMRHGRGEGGREFISVGTM